MYESLTGPAFDPDLLLPGVDPSLVMKETDPAIVDAQIVAALGMGSVFDLVNNFQTILPGGRSRQVAESDPSLLTQAPCGRRGFDEVDKVHHGERFTNITWEEFFADIDTAIESSPYVDADELERLYEWMLAAEGAEMHTRREVYLGYALPIYRELRIMGYAHYDLWR